MTGNSQYDVIVVGAGPGGTSCGALLAKQGLRVLLVDKNPQPGGRMMTLSRDGFRYELFPVFGVPGAGSQFEAVLKELDMEKEVDLLLPDPMGVIYYGAPSGEIRHIVIPGQGHHADLQDILDFLGIQQEDMGEVLRLFTDLATMSPRDIALLDDVTVREFLSSYTIPRSLYSYLVSLQSEGILECPVDVACASEFVKIFQDSLRCGGGRYASGGYGRVFEVFAEAVKNNGGDVLLQTRVEKIMVQKGRVTGVITEVGEFFAPIVISSAGIQATVLKLVGENNFDKRYVDYVRDLVPSWGFCGARYILNKPILEYPMYVFFSNNTVSTTDCFLRMETGEMPEDVYVYMGTNSLYPGMAPQGKQLVYTGITCPRNPALNPRPLLDKIEETVARVWPEVLQHVESVEYYGPADVPSVSRDVVLPSHGGECIGLAQIVGQCGRHKPSPQSPIKGLLYVGTDAGGYGLGTHQAVDSGINVAQLVLEIIGKTTPKIVPSPERERSGIDIVYRASSE